MEFTEEQKLHFAILGKRIGGTFEAWRLRSEALDEKTREIPLSEDYIQGYMFGDDIWGNGETVSSSTIQSFGPNEEYVVTRNTVYKLGRHISKCTKEELSVLITNSRNYR